MNYPDLTENLSVIHIKIRKISMLFIQNAPISKKPFSETPQTKNSLAAPNRNFGLSHRKKALQKMKFLCFPAADLTNCRKYSKIKKHAGMAELADAPDLGSGV